MLNYYKTGRKWPWRGTRVKVPKPDHANIVMKFAVTSPFFFTSIHLKMRTSDGTIPGSDVHSANTATDSCDESNVKMTVTPSQAEFLDLIRSHGYNELIRSLKKVHDLALYFTCLNFGDPEKAALHDMKVLWEGLERLEEN